MRGNVLSTIAYYLDIPSLIFVILMLYISLFAGGYTKDFHQAFATIIGRKRIAEDELEEKTQLMEYALTYAIKAIIMGSLFTMLVAVVVILSQLQDPSLIGPNLAVSILTPAYALFISLIFMMMRARIHRMR